MRDDIHHDSPERHGAISGGIGLAADSGSLRSTAGEQVSRDMERIFGAASATHRQTDRQAKASGADPVRSILHNQASKPRKTMLRMPLMALCGALIAGGLVWLAIPTRPTAKAPALPHAALATTQSPMAQRAASAPQALLAQVPQPPSTSSPHMAEPHIADRANDKAVVKAVPKKTVKPAKRIEAEQMAPRPKLLSTERAEQSCDGMSGLDRARCMRPQLLRADEQLRDAYARATRAGVKRSMLKSYRNRWSRLLDQSNSDPAHVTSSLQEMAQQLDAKRIAL